MSDHPIVPFDGGLIEAVAAQMDLRAPNREALEAVAHKFDQANGQPFEAVCDLATAVGKTYLAAGLIEYLATQGVRNFLIVAPGRTILSKTRDNFTPGHRKSVLGGMETEPYVVTIENFNTGATAAALDDPDVVKLFIFTVQSLIKPDKTSRKLRSEQEWLGEDLYQYMRDCGDLVVLSDEHHVYAETAKSFSAAVRDLDAMALVGLTATPAKTDLDKVVYHYPLARAIAEKYVKTPVLVGRKDAAGGVETRLRDGLLLLEAKQKAADAYAAAADKPPVNAVMFVVAGSIDDANAIAEVLRRPGMFADNYDEAVLTIHSEAPDDALARLAAVEEPESKVRVIVSVSMLKEGWDVKNIFVICSFRPSISDVLTEQTLGRGLRLPWGAYTGIELLDTVEVLSHESYEKLLAKAGVLLEGLTEVRAATPVVVPAVQEAPTATAPAPATPVAPAGPAAGTPASDMVVVVPDTAAEGLFAEPGDDGEASVVPAGAPAVLISSAEDRTAAAAAQADAVSKPITARTTVTVPRVERTVTSRNFQLSGVSDDEFVELGRRLASGGATTLDRKVLTVVADASAPAGYKLVPTDALGIIVASAPNLPYGGAEGSLKQAILDIDVVPAATKAGLNAAKRLAAAVVRGAGSEDALAPYLNAAIQGCRIILNRLYVAAPEVVELTVSSTTFGPTRVNTRKLEANRFGKFSRAEAYTGWSARAMHDTNWFDSTPERTLANILDAEEQVACWARIQRGEHLVVEWNGGRYSPDFYVEYAGRFYLLEVKSNKDAGTELVQAKKAAAEEWARYVTDHGDHGEWSYLLIPEEVLATAKTLAAVLTQAATY